MKKLTLFLLTAIILLLVALLATAVVWYVLVLAPLKEAAEQKPAQVPTEAVNLSTEPVPVSAETGVLEKPIVIEVATLTETQQKTVRSLGITGDEIVITPEMQVCANTKIGESRMDQIIAGDTPSFGEGISLVGCLSQ